MRIRGNKEKTQFRRTEMWRNFRKRILEERGEKCQCCGMRTKRLQLHHADGSLENYQNLDNPENFYLLCPNCHREVERLAAIKRCNWYKIRNPEWVEFYSRFIKEKNDE